MKRVVSILILTVLITAPISEVVAPCHATQEISDFYSFENDLEGWSINGTDLHLDEWDITRTQDMASDGTTAVKLDLTNNNDQGKIWIERPFPVEPNRLYEVSVSYLFASADGPFANFDIMTGVLKQRPTTRNDLTATFRESADRHKNKQGYRWLDKHYESVASSGEATR